MAGDDKILQARARDQLELQSTIRRSPDGKAKALDRRTTSFFGGKR
jgi:hypothetical protein